MQNKQHVRDLRRLSVIFRNTFAVLCPPAPITTLDNPLHNDQNPSARDIVTMAFEMPLYMALGEGFTICILVYLQLAHRPKAARKHEELLHTLSRSTGYMTECSYHQVSRGEYMATSLGNARQRPRMRPQACWPSARSWGEALHSCRAG